MKTLVISSFENPDMGCAFKFEDDVYEEAKRIVEIGWNAWWASEHEDWDTVETIGNLVVDQEYVNSLWNCGYSEGITELLDAANIAYEEVDCHDEEGNFDSDLIQEYTDWL